MEHDSIPVLMLSTHRSHVTWSWYTWYPFARFSKPSIHWGNLGEQETRAYPFSAASVVLVNDALQLSLALLAVSLKLGPSSMFKDGSLAAWSCEAERMVGIWHSWNSLLVGQMFFFRSGHSLCPVPQNRKYLLLQKMRCPNLSVSSRPSLPALPQVNCHRQTSIESTDAFMRVEKPYQPWCSHYGQSWHSGYGGFEDAAFGLDLRCRRAADPSLCAKGRNVVAVDEQRYRIQNRGWIWMDRLLIQNSKQRMDMDG